MRSPICGNAGCLLFPDTFTNYFEPADRRGRDRAASIGLGCAVTLGPPDLRCCGRPLISNGLLDQAVANARHNVERLHEWSRRGGPIIACEPSCILTIRDDYPALLKGELRSQAETVAQACLTFEEFLASIVGGGDRPIHCAGNRARGRSWCKRTVTSDRWSAPGRCCKLLRSIPGAEVIDLDAGCCGMAGSFGYEVEHYEVSRLVGEQRLLPALRQAEPGRRRGRSGILMPAPDPPFHRSRSGSSGRPAAIIPFLRT